MRAFVVVALPRHLYIYIYIYIYMHMYIYIYIYCPINDRKKTNFSRRGPWGKNMFQIFTAE
jgi:hypothetical protein